MSAKFDPEILLEMATLTKQQIIVWETASKRLIEMGKIEPLSFEGLEQAIDNIAYRIFTISMYSFLQRPDLIEATPEDFLNDEQFGDDVEKLDDVINMTAIASCVHPAIVAAKIDLKVAEYIEQLPSPKKA